MPVPGAVCLISATGSVPWTPECISWVPSVSYCSVPFLALRATLSVSAEALQVPRWSRIIACVVQAILPCRQSVQSLLFSQHCDVVDSSVNDYNPGISSHRPAAETVGYQPVLSSRWSSFSSICQKRSAFLKFFFLVCQNFQNYNLICTSIWALHVE